ncbi:hypothetical protein DFQ30_005687, partial [Apophysomyces sp. BC1015]
GTVALLVHSDYKVELESILRSQDITVKQGFNPCNADIVGDIQHATKTTEERKGIAKNIFAERQIRLCLRLPTHLGNSVMRFFTNTSSDLKIDSSCYAKYIERRTPTAKTAPVVLTSLDKSLVTLAKNEDDDGMEDVEKTAPIQDQ